MKNLKLESKFIKLRGAKMHNLKNIDLDIPKNKLVVITGLSGSGKSSLAFDTLYAEGQRRYIESLSSYARQFLGKLNKPKVDSIIGISPAIAIEQKVNNSNPRSTVGTSSEIYDYLKLLYARIGRTFSPVSNSEVKKDSIDSVLEKIKKFNIDDKFLILSPKKIDKQSSTKQVLSTIKDQGFARIKINGEVKRIDDIKEIDHNDFYIVVDRSVYKDDTDYIEKLYKTYTSIGYQCLKISVKQKTNIEKVKKFMENNVSVFTGHSGVGKSSMMNALDSNLNLKTSEISKQNDQGQHTTTFAEMFDFNNGAKVIDSPGIKGFGLIDIEKNEIGGYFVEIAKLSTHCKFNNCLHLNEPNCAVKSALEANDISESRYVNYLSILNDDENNFR